MQASTEAIPLNPFVKGSQELAQTQKVANELLFRLQGGNFWGPKELKSMLLKSINQLDAIEENS